MATRIRLLADTPEGAPGNEVVVAANRARDLISIGQAVRVAVVRSGPVVVERTTTVEQVVAPVVSPVVAESQTARVRRRAD